MRPRPTPVRPSRRPRRSTWAAAALVTTLAMTALTACGSGGGPQGSSGRAGSTSLTLAVGDISGGEFDPVKGWGTRPAQIRPIHSSLLKVNAALEFEGDLATGHTVSEDGLVWKLPLRKDAEFSNGEPVTAHDVRFTYELLKKEGVRFDLDFVNGIRAVDEHTVEFTLSAPRSTFVSQLTEIPILPRKHYGKDYSANPIGSGPYRVADYQDGQQLILERNPHWYGTAPQFDKLTFLFLAEDAALAAARAGKVDVLYVPPTFAGQKLPGMSLKRYESVDSRGLSLPTQPSGKSGRINGKDVAVGNDVTADPAIRKALNIGLDREAIVDVALQGHGRPAYSLADTLPWFNGETVFKDGDVKGAKKLLTAAGWVDRNGDGVLDKDGRPASFTLLHPADDNLRSDLALVVSEQARALGIDIKVKGSSWDGIYADGKANAVTWGGGRHHPHQMYEMYATDEHNIGYNNMPHYSNARVDAAMKRALAATTQEEANSWWKKAQWDGTGGFAGAEGDAPLVWLARIDHLYFVADGLDLGKQPVHAHGHEWALFNTIADWRWNR